MSASASVHDPIDRGAGGGSASMGSSTAGAWIPGAGLTVPGCCAKAGPEKPASARVNAAVAMARDWGRLMQGPAASREGPSVRRTMHRRAPPL